MAALNCTIFKSENAKKTKANPLKSTIHNSNSPMYANHHKQEAGNCIMLWCQVLYVAKLMSAETRGPVHFAVTMPMLVWGLAVGSMWKYSLRNFLWKLHKETCKCICQYSQAYCIPFCFWLITFCDSLFTLACNWHDPSRQVVNSESNIAVFPYLMEVACDILSHERLQGLVLGLMGLLDGSPQCITSIFVSQSVAVQMSSFLISAIRCFSVCIYATCIYYLHMVMVTTM